MASRKLVLGPQLYAYFEKLLNLEPSNFWNILSPDHEVRRKERDICRRNLAKVEAYYGKPYTEWTEEERTPFRVNAKCYS